RLRLPPGWKFGTALPVAQDRGEVVDFLPVTLTRLVDSPVLAGAYFRRIPLTPGAVPGHFIDMAAYSREALEMPGGLATGYLHSRSGLTSGADWRQGLAQTAAYLDQRPGRTWRPLRDTAIGAQLLYGSRPEWQEWRRGTDFYNESLLIWLEADVLIRSLTHGAKSLDDFCKAIHSDESGVPKIVPYTFEDVVGGLNAVAPYDWGRFLDEHLDSTAPHAPLGGITNGGWKLAWSDTLPGYTRAGENARKNVDER